MSNHSNPELISTVKDSFLNWFQNDILPYFVATFDILTIIVGVILNVILILTFKKRGLFKEPSSHFVFMLSISDFIAYVLVLLPTIIAAFAKTWILSLPVCYINGCTIVLIIYVSFLFLTLLAVERAVKLTNLELYEKTFESKKLMNIITVVVWLLSSIVAFVTIVGLAEIKYEFYHQGCMLNYLTSYALLTVHFVTGLGIPFITMTVCYSLIFDSRRRALKEAKQAAELLQDKRRSRVQAHKDMRVIDLPTITEEKSTCSSTDKDEPAAGEPTKEINTNSPRKSMKKFEKTESKQSLLLEVFSDDDENPAFHLAITYLLLWSVLILCYFPYYTVWYYDAYNDGTIWGGFYTITMLIIHTSFALKPIIYLGHNRHYRAVTKEVIPEGVRARAKAMKESVSSAVDRVDDFVFRSSSNKRFVATVNAQKAVLIWKKKLQNIRTKKFQLKDNGYEKTPIVPLSTSESSKANNTDKLSKEAHQKDVTGEVNGDLKEPTCVNFTPNPVTPSNVEIASSSFIERERQKLLGNISAPPPANYEELNIVPPAVYEEERI